MANNSTNPKAISFMYFPNAGKTVATLKGCGDNMDDLLWKLTINNSKYFGYAGGSDAPTLRNKYRACASVNTDEGDTWDEAIGRTEAYRKVMQKYHRDMDRNMREILKDLHGLCAGIEHYMDKRGISYESVPSVEELKNKRFLCGD